MSNPTATSSQRPPWLNLPAKRKPPPWALACLALIVIGAIAGSLYWVNRNIVLVGRDSAGHLEQSLFVANALSSGFPQGLFQAVTLDDYRPPALYLVTQPFYWLGGRSMDVAQLPNILLLAVVLILTYALARRSLGEAYALFAVLLLALLPMPAAMSRFYYMENLLTAALLAGLWALLNSQGFTHRGWSLAFGASLGVLLLIKWTAPIYLLAPLLYVLWCAGYWPAQMVALRSRQVDWRRFAVSLAGGVILALLWYWPNREFVLKQEMPLGDWLVTLWALLFALVIYSLSGRSASLVGNLWAALLLALAIASLWYLPRVDFILRLSDVAFGSDRGTQQSLNLLRPSNYTRYFGFWLSHHMGPLATLLVITPALVGWLLWLRRHRKHEQTDILVYGLMLLASWILLTLIAQANPRNLVPLLPVIAILLAAGLRGFVRPLALAIAVVWVSVLGMQWSIYTFDRLAPLQARTPQLWVAGDYLQWPATASTDPGYWIQPDVLATIGSPQGEADSLGILVDTWEIHRGAFRYLTTLANQNLTVNPLTESNSRGWPDVLANRWLLVKDGDNSEVKAPGQAVLADIRQGSPLFDQLYTPVRDYQLPNGDTVTLYHRTDGPSQPQDYPVILIEAQPVAETLDSWWSAGATLVFGDRDTAVWLGMQDLKSDRILLPKADGSGYPQPLDELTGTILLVTRYDQSVRDQVAAGSYYAREFTSGDIALSIFGRPTEPLTELAVQSPWPLLEVQSLRSLPGVAGGQVLPIEMSIHRTDGGSLPLKLSLRLLDSTGDVVAQNDVAAEDATQAGLFVPPKVTPGPYTLAAVLYDPATMQPIVTQTGEQMGILAEIKNVGS